MRLRGRKGILEAIESQHDLVILNPQEHRGKWREVFGNDKPIYVELGMGKGRFVSEMSRLNKDANFIGIDMYDELIRRASEKARAAHTDEQGGCDLSNIRLARCNIESIEQVFAEDELRRIYLNFSDPWPKARHARRRLTHRVFLQKYISLLDRLGEIHFKTDSETLFEFSLNSFADMGLRMRNISLNLHREGLHEDNVMTEYEMKFSGRGMNIHRCEVVVGEDALAEHLEELRKRTK